LVVIASGKTITMPGIGRLKKRRRGPKKATENIEPPTTPSRAANTDKKAGIREVMESNFLHDLRENGTKETKFEKVHAAVQDLINEVFEKEEEAVECVIALAQKLDPALFQGPSTDGAPVIKVPPTEEIPFNPKAFLTKELRDGTSETRSEGAAKTEKWRQVNLIENAITSIGNAQQQLLAIHGFLQSRETAKPLINALGCCLMDDETAMNVALIQNVRRIFAIAARPSRNKRNDTKSFIKTVMIAIAPDGNPTPGFVGKLGRVLNLKRNTFKRHFQKAIATRKAIVASQDNPLVPMVQLFQRKTSSKYTPSLIEKIHKWIFEKCEQVVPSPTKKDSVLCTDVNTGEKVRRQKHYYINSVRELHNELIRPEAEGGLAEARTANGEVLISDTVLRSLLPRNLSRLTDSQKQMCGCEICIVCKAMLNTLNAWRTRTIKSIESAAEQAHPQRAQILREEARAYRDFVRNGDGSPKHKTPEDVIGSMTCERVPVEGRLLHRLKCALGRCDDCPSLLIPAQEQDTSRDARIISFEMYEYHSFCTLHKSLEGAPTSCDECEDMVANAEGNVKRGKVIRKKQLTRKTKKIGDFIRDDFIPMMTKGRYHFLFVSLLGKFHCIKQRKNAYKLVQGSCLTQRDYADHLNAEFADEAQSTHFGDNAGISMEGVTVRTHVNGQETLSYHSYISDNNRQDSRTTFANTDALVLYLLEQQKMMQQSTYYELMDGCAKQYRCANALFFMSVLASKYRIMVDRMILLADEH
jgi:hypothetical protein